jgi:hypothetical protein
MRAPEAAIRSKSSGCVTGAESVMLGVLLNWHVVDPIVAVHADVG